tara:strand:- start:22909 stop:23622 length:714 start_codon:yes stop_codon:yes gene_type:complete
MKLLILLLFSLSSWAQFVPVSEIDAGSVTTVYRSQSICPGQCLKIPVGYNKAFHKKVEIMKPDLENPTITKSQGETCLDDEDCQSKLEAKTCTDIEERAVKVLDSDPKEVYCTKTTYPQIGSGQFKVVEDPDLKSDWISKRNARLAKEKEISDKMKDMNFGRRVYASVQILNKKKGLSKAQRRQLRNTLKTMRDDLLDGSICDVRQDLIDLNADGTLIMEDDKTQALKMIDDYKSCQ